MPVAARMASQGPAWVRLIMPSRLARARSICAAGCEIRAAQATHAWVAQPCRLSSQKERHGGDGLGDEPSCVLHVAFRPHGGAFGRPSTRKRDLQQFPRLRIDLRASSAHCAVSGARSKSWGSRAGGCAEVTHCFAAVGPGWKIQEVSRVGAQSVTSKSTLLALEMLRVCIRGLRVDSGAI